MLPWQHHGRCHFVSFVMYISGAKFADHCSKYFLEIFLIQYFIVLSKRSSLHSSQVAHQVGAYPGFCSMKRLGVFLLPLDGMLVHRRVTPSIKFASAHLNTWVERGTVRVEVSCPTTQHNVPGQGSNPERSFRNRVR